MNLRKMIKTKYLMIKMNQMMKILNQEGCLILQVKFMKSKINYQISYSAINQIKTLQGLTNFYQTSRQ